ncbi:phytoene synthase [Abditibacterium utsteinense]|uniref:Phytoene synthase n=1 Tax=Abditibacterium utsteinense TaxID=1960156 RepID=A0A2S8SV79_9BACT|nr:phytoene/squalene synthase family protein [Abditibacterium utsteinense]PQV64707.1 phytoene synthase [Abditibacterium utsteinense]
MTSAPSTFDKAAALRQARAILRHHGKSYYYSTCLFPRELQDATCAIYAFVRLPDEIVDNSPQETPEDLQKVNQDLREFGDEWRLAYQSGESKNPILQLTAQTWHKYQIPYSYSEDFLRAMMQDTHQTDYATYQELEKYMYGSAAVIGLMMSHLVGYQGEQTLEHAQKLGYAMQLTNFLRDIDEDCQLRNRVYMPSDELKQFDLSRNDIENRHFSPDFRAFMEFQGARAHQLYEEANLGIPMLHKEGRFAVATASTLYRAILGKLEQEGWNPFPKRVKTSMPEKIVLTGRAWKLSRGA